MQRLIIVIIFSLTLVITCNAQKSKTLPDVEKIQIIKEILSNTDFSRDLVESENRKIVYLSMENISAELLPQLPPINFILLSEEEIEAKTKSGFGYHAFGEFKTKGSKVLVNFTYRWENSSFGTLSYNGTRYEFRKIKGRWKSKRIGFILGES